MAEPTFAELMSLNDMTREKAVLILLIMRGDLEPADFPEMFPQTTGWMRRCHHTPPDYSIQEHAIAELLDTTFEALEVEGAPHSSFEGVKCFGIVGGYANAGDPYVATIVHSYRNLDMREQEGAFEEDGWYVACWADLLEAAEFTYREEEEPEEEDDGEGYSDRD